MTAFRKHTACRICIFSRCCRDGCPPSFGPCSLPDWRKAALDRLRLAVRRNGGPVFLKSPVTVMEDHFAGQVPRTVRRVSAFCDPVGKTPALSLGEDLTTDHVGTEDLERINREIKLQ